MELNGTADKQMLERHSALLRVPFGVSLVFYNEWFSYVVQCAAVALLRSFEQFDAVALPPVV